MQLLRFMPVIALALACGRSGNRGSAADDSAAVEPAPLAVPSPAGAPDAGPPPPIDPAALPPWPVAAGKQGTAVAIHAVDASADELGAILAGNRSFVARASNARLTGRLEAADLAAATAALAAIDPAVAPPPLAMRGTGVKIDLAFQVADGASLFRLLAGLGRRTIVLGADPGQLGFRIRRIPWDGVVDGAAAALGWKRHVAGTLILVGPADRVPDAALLRTPGPLLDLLVHDLTAGEALALAAAAGAPVPQVAACGAGPRIRVRLRDVSPAQAAAAVLYAAGLPRQPAPAAPCAALDPAAAASADPDAAALGGLAFTQGGAAAAITTPAGPAVIVGTGSLVGTAPVSIGPGHLLLGGRAIGFPDSGDLGPPPPAPPTPMVLWECSRRAPFIASPPAGLRLAATLVHPGGGSALFVDGDTWHRVDATGAGAACRIDIEPGRARIGPAGAPPGSDLVREWRLQRAAR